jgi:hypothetical protein
VHIVGCLCYVWQCTTRTLNQEVIKFKYWYQISTSGLCHISFMLNNDSDFGHLFTEVNNIWYVQLMGVIPLWTLVHIWKPECETWYNNDVFILHVSHCHSTKQRTFVGVICLITMARQSLPWVLECFFSMSCRTPVFIFCLYVNYHLRNNSVFYLSFFP